MTEVISVVQTSKQHHRVEPSERREAITLLKAFKSMMNYRATYRASHLFVVLFVKLHIRYQSILYLVALGHERCM